MGVDENCLMDSHLVTLLQTRFQLIGLMICARTSIGRAGVFIVDSLDADVGNIQHCKHEKNNEQLSPANIALAQCDKSRVVGL